MNQNTTTIETIREAINMIRLSRVCSGNHLVSCGFCSENMETTENNLRDLANHLEAAPQPLVEQSEPKSGVWIAGQWREIREGGFCPNCSHKPGDCIAGTCAWQCFHVSLGAPQARTHIWLAPAAVIEPEPVCATCDDTGLIEKGHPRFEGPCPDGCAESRSLHPQFWKAVDQKREIISRKGDK